MPRRRTTAEALGVKVEPRMVSVEPKPAQNSLTILANVAGFVVFAIPGLLTYLGGTLDPETLAKITLPLGLLMTVANLYLRYWKTAGPIAGSPQDPPDVDAKG